MDTDVSPQSWLVLLPQLPAKPDYLRVKLQRRLARLGAVTVKNGVYALPLRDETTEASEWLRTELVHDKGDLIVLGSVVCAGISDDELVQRFLESSRARYDTIATGARDALANESADLRRTDLARLRKAMAQAESTDFFDCAERDEAQAVLAKLEQSLREPEARVVAGK